MTKLHGGTAVKSGYYFNRSNWEFTMVSDDGGLLPGAADQRYHKVPLLLLLLAAPIIGGLFVMFLPLIGFAMAAAHLAKAVLRGVRNVGSDLAASMGQEMVPGEAHFAGRGRQEKDNEAKEDRSLAELQRHVDEQRKSEK